MIYLMFTLLYVIAQAHDPISGGAGWIGAGLLGAVLAWLMMIHLPAKDKQMQSMIDSHVSSMRDLIDKKSATIKDVITIAQKNIETVVSASQNMINASNDHCQSELEKIVNSFRYELDRIFEFTTNRTTTIQQKQKGGSQ